MSKKLLLEALFDSTMFQYLCLFFCCSLSRLCQRALMPRSQESYIEDIFNHLLPYEQGLLPVSLQEKPMEATNECNIPIVFHCLPQISSTETSLYLCNIASWSQVGSLVKIMSADWCIAFGRAHSYLLTNENYNTFAWCIESCSPQAIYDLNKDRAQIW